MLQVGTEIRLTLRQSDTLPQNFAILCVSEGIFIVKLFYKYVIGYQEFTFLENYCISAFVVAGKSPLPAKSARN